MSILLFQGDQIISNNAEIAVESDIIIRCPNAKYENEITWQLWTQDNTTVAICTRRPTESGCWPRDWQSPQYRNRVTRDNSAGQAVGAYSIRVSGVLINETGRYSCKGHYGNSPDLDVFNNVRIISEFCIVIISIQVINITILKYIF